MLRPADHIGKLNAPVLIIADDADQHATLAEANHTRGPGRQKVYGSSPAPPTWTCTPMPGSNMSAWCSISCGGICSARRIIVGRISAIARNPPFVWCSGGLRPFGPDPPYGRPY